MCQRRRDLQAGSLVSRWTTVSAGGHLRGGCVEKSPVPRHYSKIAAGMLWICCTLRILACLNSIVQRIFVSFFVVRHAADVDFVMIWQRNDRPDAGQSDTPAAEARPSASRTPSDSVEDASSSGSSSDVETGAKASKDSRWHSRTCYGVFPGEP